MGSFVQDYLLFSLPQFFMLMPPGMRLYWSSHLQQESEAFPQIQNYCWAALGSMTTWWYWPGYGRVGFFNSLI